MPKDKAKMKDEVSLVLYDKDGKVKDAREPEKEVKSSRIEKIFKFLIGLLEIWQKKI